MPRVHFVKKARKAIESHGIAVGDSYYWWKNRAKGARSGFKRISKKRPRPSQLTMSEFYGAVYAAQEDVEDAVSAFRSGDHDLEGLASALEEAATAIREQGESCDEKFNGMPDGLQQGDTGQLLEARRDACESLADALESAASEIRDMKPDEPQDDALNVDEGVIEEAAQKAEDIDWTFE